MGKRSWILYLILFSFLSFISYGFIKDLYFWRDDYALLYRFQQGSLFSWPYQGTTLVIYPLYLLFGNAASGYFISALFLYILFCFAFSFFIWRVTHDKLVSFLSGLLVASGAVGSESMVMAMVAITSIAYMVGVLFIILLYRGYMRSGSRSVYLLVLFFYLIIVFLFTQRAHSLILIIFVSDYFFALDYQARKRVFLKHLLNSFLRTFPFLLITLILYFFAGKDENGSAGISNILVYYLQNFKLKSITNLFFNLSSYLFPVSSAIWGVFMILFLTWFLVLKKISLKERRTGFLLVSLWIASYITYHLYDPMALHESSQRYLIFGYPFFIALLSLIIGNIFFTPKTKATLIKILGVGVVFIMIGIHQNQMLPLKNAILSRAGLARNFFSTLKMEVPHLKKRALFYFDVVENPSSQASFWDILRVGVYPTEASIASFYGVKMEDIKIADNYLQFLSEKKSGEFAESNMFFYDQNNELLSINKLSQTNNIKFSQISLNKEYRSVVSSNQSGSSSINGLLKFTADNFPSYAPVTVRVTMKVKDLMSDIISFPFSDASVSNEQKNINTDFIHDSKYRQLLFNYIKERNYFRKLANINSSKNNPGKGAENAIDGRLATVWEADKREWVEKKSVFLEITFKEKFNLSQVRWSSASIARLPASYGYQIYDDNINKWIKVYQVENLDLSKNEYVVDSFKTISTKRFRMVIRKTLTGDFPGISEIELLPSNVQVGSQIADLITEHPFVQINNRDELVQFINNLSTYLEINIYPLSDKYLYEESASRVSAPIFLDDRYHTYEFKLPPSGTKLNGLMIKFPNIPIEALVSKISLALD